MPNALDRTIGLTVTFVAAIVVLMVVILAKQPDDADYDLGSVSQHWIAEHRLDSQ
jgi:hypothetical protein